MATLVADKQENEMTAKKKKLTDKQQIRELKEDNKFLRDDAHEWHMKSLSKDIAINAMEKANVKTNSNMDDISQIMQQAKIQIEMFHTIKGDFDPDTFNVMLPTNTDERYICFIEDLLKQLGTIATGDDWGF